MKSHSKSFLSSFHPSLLKVFLPSDFHYSVTSLTGPGQVFAPTHALCFITSSAGLALLLLLSMPLPTHFPLNSLSSEKSYLPVPSSRVCNIWQLQFSWHLKNVFFIIFVMNIYLASSSRFIIFLRAVKKVWVIFF